MWLLNRLISFKYAFQGMGTLFREEANARIHLIAALIAVAAGFYFGISPVEWCAVILAIALVLAAELFNTAIETLADYAAQGRLVQNHWIGKTKDLAAAGVLMAAVAALIVGLIVFLPKILNHA